VTSDGTSLLDEIWAGASFATSAWVAAGLLTQANGRTVVSTAQQATYVS
jgi:hypothetical protein